MKRALIALALVAAAAVVFVVGRGMTAEPLRASVAGARYAATVVIDRPTTGRVTVEVEVTSGEADTAAVSTVMTGMGHATPELPARRTGPGRFAAEGELFPMAGTWEVSIRLGGPAGEETLVVNALTTG
ncbi:FixH family protein [Actinomadura sp. ATCC 31491]|uniref:FixH family protein n=1 Tax=Actinomadura luzonensis TaxID=2805427 RepID=A0ABT0FT79_9ACTN|nr:FixH family protein [Actinomadura luzonensis]MCK2215545.1 FixH family protein [Actinomadura luzonensis]